MTLGCAAANAQAASFFEIETGIGGALYGKAPNGLWWQEGFQHNLQLAAPAFEAGFTRSLYQSSHWGISWHADWVWLGTTHYDADVPSPYSNTTSGHWAAPGFVGGGHDQGFMFSIESHIDHSGWRVGVELSPYIHRSTWSEDLYGWFAPDATTPSNLHIQHDPMAARVHGRG